MTQAQRIRITHKDMTDSTTVDLTETYEIDTTEGIAASIDSFSFNLLVGAKPVRTFELNDEINIYIDETTGNPTTVLHNGIISEVSYSLGIDGFGISIRGINRIERLMFSPRPALYATTFAYTDVNSVARVGWGAIITHLIDKANEFAGNNVSLITYDINSIPELGVMPQRYDSDWKAIYEHIERLVTPEWTPNGQEYLIELDITNKLQLRSKDTGAYQTFTSTINIDGSNVLSCGIIFGVFDIVNAVLLNCGKSKDASGNRTNSVLVPRWDSNSMNLYGAKTKYIVMEEIANKYYAAGNDTGRTVEEQRTDIKALGRIESKLIIDTLGSAKYKADIDLIGTNSYTRGKIYTIVSDVIPTLATGKLMRVYDIVHRFSGRSGWTTRLQLKEDAKTIQYGGS